MPFISALTAVWVWATYTFGPLSQPVDAHAYWVADPAHLYPNLELARDGYYYPLPFEYLVAWGRLLPFEAFVALWRAILLAALVYLAGPLTVFVLFTVPVASEINAGNIQILLALAVVLGFRFPAAWAFVLLTKVSPGVGLLWFAVRREWRALGIVTATTATLVAVSLITHGSQWPSYLELITSGQTPSVAPYYASLWIRLPVSIALVTVGALGGWRWTVPVAAMLALPVFYIISWSMLVGVLPFARQAAGRWLARRGITLQRRSVARRQMP